MDLLWSGLDAAADRGYAGWERLLDPAFQPGWNGAVDEPPLYLHAEELQAPLRQALAVLAELFDSFNEGFFAARVRLRCAD